MYTLGTFKVDKAKSVQISGLSSRVAAVTSSSQCRGAEVTSSMGAGRAVVGTHDLEAVLLHLF